MVRIANADNHPAGLAFREALVNFFMRCCSGEADCLREKDLVIEELEKRRLAELKSYLCSPFLASKHGRGLAAARRSPSHHKFLKVLRDPHPLVDRRRDAL